MCFSNISFQFVLLAIVLLSHSFCFSKSRHVARVVAISSNTTNVMNKRASHPHENIHTNSSRSWQVRKYHLENHRNARASFNIRVGAVALSTHVCRCKSLAKNQSVQVPCMSMHEALMLSITVGKKDGILPAPISNTSFENKLRRLLSAKACFEHSWRPRGFGACRMQQPTRSCCIYIQCASSRL